MLKTFTIKQLDVLRRDFYRQIRNGDAVGGTANLVRYGAILGTSNASVEQVKAWILGKDVEFDDLVIARLYGNYGVSPYVLDLLKKGKPAEAAVSLLVPPFNVIDNLGRDIVELGENMRTLKNLPPFGKGWFFLFGEEDRLKD